MKIKSISYLHSFNVTGFLNDKVGIEIELNEKDNADEAFAFAIKKTNEIATRVQDGFMNGAPQSIPAPGPSAEGGSAIGITVESINSCKTMKSLEIYELIIDSEKDAGKRKQLWDAYDKRHAQLLSE